MLSWLPLLAFLLLAELKTSFGEWQWHFMNWSDSLHIFLFLPNCTLCSTSDMLSYPQFPKYRHFLQPFLPLCKFLHISHLSTQHQTLSHRKPFRETPCFLASMGALSFLWHILRATAYLAFSLTSTSDPSAKWPGSSKLSNAHLLENDLNFVYRNLIFSIFISF